MPVSVEEIAYVFTRIGHDIVNKEPLLFGDFSLSPDGWTPKYPKV